jgi:archaetidylinositol phosphate synthase
MIESYVRPSYQRYFMDPLAKLLLRMPFITPNRVTTLSVIFGVIAAVLFAFQLKYSAVILLLLSGMCDTLDGTLARISSRSTDIGSAWDIVADRIVEFCVIFSFYFYAPSHDALAVLMMLGSSYLCITTFLVVGIFAENHSQKGFHYSAGLMERPEAFIFFIVMMLFPVAIPILGWIYAVLVFYTAAIRMLEFRRHEYGSRKV